MERSVCYFTANVINCGCIPSEVILCVVQDSVRNFVRASLVRREKQPHWNTIPCLYSYQFIYDDAQLVSYDPDTQSATDPLETADITGVLCVGCLTDFIDSTHAPVSADPDNCIQLREDGLYIPCANSALVTSVSDTPSINLTVLLGDLSANVFISADPGNTLSVQPDGLFAADFIASAADTATVNLTVLAGVLSADVKISADLNNCLTENPDGLFVPCAAADFIGSVGDTATVDLTVTGDVLTADVEVSANAGNLITAVGDGLYATPSVLDSTTIDFSVAAGVISGSVKVSADAFNLVESHADGLWVPATDGWIPFNTALTFISATSFSLVGDWTDRLVAGDKVKLDNATTKWFSIISVTFALGVTTVVVTAGIDYTLVAGAITGFFSHDESPAQFPDYFTYVPLSTPVGGMTFGITSTVHSFFKIHGSQCSLSLYLIGTTSGVDGNQVKLSLPVNSSAFIEGSGAIVYTGVGSHRAGQAFITPSDDTINFYTYDALNFGLGVGRAVLCSMDYRIA